MNYKELFFIIPVTVLLSSSTVFGQSKLDFKPTPSQTENEYFLAEILKTPGVKVTASGLQYKIVKKGYGEKPIATDKIAMRFDLRLINGKKVGGNEQNILWEHHIDKALLGIQEALLMMPVGSEWILYIPSNLAFGQDGYNSIPPSSTIVCDVELVSIIK